MLSKVAERVYWMARSLERTENTARLISVHTSLLMDMPAEMEINWFTLVKIFNAESLYHELHLTINESDIMHFLVAEESNPSSLIRSLKPGLRHKPRRPNPLVITSPEQMPKHALPTTSHCL